MRRMVSCALFLCVVYLCVCTAAAQKAEPAAGYVPGPTPQPMPAVGVPARTASMEGVDAAQWKEAFFAYADAQGIPVEEGGFQLIFEWERKHMFDAAC